MEEDAKGGGGGGLWSKSEHKNQCKHCTRYKVTSSLRTVLCLDAVVRKLFMLASHLL